MSNNPVEESGQKSGINSVVMYFTSSFLTSSKMTLKSHTVFGPDNPNTSVVTFKSLLIFIFLEKKSRVTRKNYFVYKTS